MTVFYFLLRAHDHLLANREWALKDRIDACAIFWRLALSVPANKLMPTAAK